MSLLVAFAFTPLLLLVGLRFVRDATRRSLFASFIFFLPMLLMAGLLMLTTESEIESPGLKDASGLIVVLIVIWAVFTGVLSLLRGMACVSTYPLALLWIIPEALVCLMLGIVLLRIVARV